MNNIKWEDGAVCYTAKKQWNSILQYEVIIDLADFQLNEIRTGDYISASELDTEQKYNDAVEVFELFGFRWGEDALNIRSDVMKMGSLTICHDGIFATEVTPKWCARKITFSQLMAIGKLKRAMIEREKWNDINEGADKLLFKHASNEDFEKAIDKVKELEGFGEYAGCNNLGDKSNSPEFPDSSKRNKSKQAYEILKSLDYDYDLVKQKWYKKEWV